MKTRFITAIIGCLLIIGIGYGVFLTNKPITGVENPSQPEAVSMTTEPVTEKPQPTIQPATPPIPPSVSEPAPTQAKAPTTFTLEQIAAHNTRESCWSAINGVVYDLTSWIPNHPGGEKRILNICGIDGTISFNGKHSGSSKIAKILTGFAIGTF